MAEDSEKKAEEQAAPKATETEIALRIEEVKRLLLTAQTRARILQYAAEKWQLSERQTDTYIARARREIKQEVDKRAPHALSTNLARREDIYRHALNTGDFRLALDILKDIDKVLGHYAPEESKQSGEIKIKVVYGDDGTNNPAS